MFVALTLVAVALVFVDIRLHLYADESAGISLRRPVFQGLAILSSGGF